MVNWSRRYPTLSSRCYLQKLAIPCHQPVPGVFLWSVGSFQDVEAKPPDYNAVSSFLYLETVDLRCKMEHAINCKWLHYSKLGKNQAHCIIAVSPWWRQGKKSSIMIFCRNSRDSFSCHALPGRGIVMRKHWIALRIFATKQPLISVGLNTTS